jgi:hypothetical protein
LLAKHHKILRLIFTLKVFADGSKRMRKEAHIACCDPCISVAESRPLWAVTTATTSRNRMRRSLPTCHCLPLRAQTTFRSPPSGPLGFTGFVIIVCSLVTKPKSCVIAQIVNDYIPQTSADKRRGENGEGPDPNGPSNGDLPKNETRKVRRNLV